jgi:diadenosine tetraphosphate (Ap4A) HIT family hydrolase
MSDLTPDERAGLMAVVFAVEEAVRATMQADKMNLASLGNMTPHVHWHVIPRFRDDRHFPTPVWAAPQREAAVPPQRRERAMRVSGAIVERLGK